MLRSVRSQALLVVLASVIASVAVSACPQPVIAMVDQGGLCVDPWFGDPYCTQPKVTRNGSCTGPNDATVNCVIVPQDLNYPSWKIRYPQIKSCTQNACDTDYANPVRLVYNVAGSGREACMTGPVSCESLQQQESR